MKLFYLCELMKDGKMKKMRRLEKQRDHFDVFVLIVLDGRLVVVVLAASQDIVVRWFEREWMDLYRSLSLAHKLLELQSLQYIMIVVDSFRVAKAS